MLDYHLSSIEVEKSTHRGQTSPVRGAGRQTPAHL